MRRISFSDRIFVAGHNGLVGSAILKCLTEQGYKNLILRTRSELDLTDGFATREFYKSERPDIVFVAAAKVGGIFANNAYPADFIHENLTIQNNLIWGAHLSDVRRLIFLGSSCIYPRNSKQPIQETELLRGELEITNRPYAIAKIAGLELVHCLRRQFGRDYFSVMPTNLYGVGDNFHPENAHVLPMLIRRFCEAVDSGKRKVTIWGTGTPRREFMNSTDCADAIVFLAGALDPSAEVLGSLDWSHVNVGTGEEVTIRELAEMLREATGFEGELEFDQSKPDGTPRKLLDSSLLRNLGWSPKVRLGDGIAESVTWFRKQQELLNAK